MFLLILLISLGTGCKILTLSGGGAHGAFQAGVLNRLVDVGKEWDIITGISVGSLNGIVMGLFKPSDQLKAVHILRDLWLTISVDNVYKWNLDPFYDQSVLDNSPLNQTVYDVVSKYGGVVQRDLLIGSASLNTGLLRLFNRSEFYSVLRTTDIVMASSSIPIIFPPRYLDNNYYVDGGTFSNEIVKPAIEYCLDHGHEINNITIDIIICSPPISYVNNRVLSKDHTYGLGCRAYDIATEALSNHELYTDCNDNQVSFPMNIYKPYLPYPGSLLDFNHETLVKTYNIGYNIKSPVLGKYCY